MRRSLVAALSSALALILAIASRTPELCLLYLSTSVLILSRMRPPQGREDEVPDDVITFLNVFSSELRKGNGQEAALLKSVEGAPCKGQEYESLAAHVINGLPAEECIRRRLGSKNRLEPVSHLVPLNLIRKNSVFSGELMQRRLHSYNQFRRLAKERKEILRVLSFRAKIMTVAFSLALAALTTLIPFTSMFSSGLKPASTLSSDLNELAILQSFIVAFTVYLAAKSSGSNKAAATALVSLALYWIAFTAFSTQMLVFKY